MRKTLLLVVVLSSCMGCDTALQPNSKPLPESSTAVIVPADELLKQVDQALDFTFERRLTTEKHAAWQILHGCVAYRREFLILHAGQDRLALDYLFNNGTVEGWEFEPGKVIDATQGRRGLRAIVRPGSSTAQGHADQWLGYLAGCDYPLDEPLKIGGQTYLLSDYLTQMEFDVPHNVAREYSWTLMALAKYRPHDYTWEAADGNTWSVEKLVEIELEQDLDSSACAGAHRMVGLALAYQRFTASGQEPTGIWRKLEERLREVTAKVREYQNADGSLSSASFAKPSQSADVGSALNAAGHVLEFLTVVLPEEELRADWVTRAVLAQCKMLRKTRGIEVNCGGLYHSASGLRIYRERIFGPRKFGKEKLAT
jgi:hypothetical protein